MNSYRLKWSASIPHKSMAETIREGFKRIHNMDGLVTGHRQVFKYLERKRAKVCFLASDCEEKAYADIVECLCKEYKVRLCKKFSRKTLGELAGQVRCLADSDKIIKVVPASACVIHNFVGMSPEDVDNFINKLDEQ